MVHRNVALPGTTTFDNYRIVPVQFQNIMPSESIYGADPRDSDKIEITLTMEDNTHTLIDVLLNDFMEAYEQLIEYHELASEYCAYNNINNSGFNDFFIEFINAKYGDDKYNTPWIKSPAVMIMYRDLFYNVYNGDLSIMRESAVTIAKQIAPETGTLADLDEFVESLSNINELLNTMQILRRAGAVAGSYAVPYAVLGLDQSFSVTVDISDYGLPDFLGLEDFQIDLDTLSAVAREEYSNSISKVYNLFSEMYIRMLELQRNFTDASDKDEKASIKLEVTNILLGKNSYIRQMGEILLEIGEIDSLYMKQLGSFGYDSFRDGYHTKYPSNVIRWIMFIHQDYLGGSHTFSYTDGYGNTIEAYDIVSSFGKFVDAPEFTSEGVYSKYITVRDRDSGTPKYRYGYIPRTSGGNLVRFHEDETQRVLYNNGSSQYYTYNANSYKFDGFPKNSDGTNDYKIGDITDILYFVRKAFSATGRASWSDVWEDNNLPSAGVAGSFGNSAIENEFKALFCATIEKDGKCSAEYYEAIGEGNLDYWGDLYTGV